jgi:hypothetical protein
LACDTTEASRQEAARSADFADIFHVVDILSEEEFLRTKTLFRARSRTVTGIRERHTEASYVKNLIADSGKIFATDSPLPTQKAAIPPSAYIRAIADMIALAPRTVDSGCSEVPPRSGGLVIRKIFRRSNGAVDVRDTVHSPMRTQRDVLWWMREKESLTCACYTSGCQKLESSCATQPVVLHVVVLLEQVVIAVVAVVCVVRSCIVGR